MDASIPRDRKVSVPSPLPTRRGQLYIPPVLSDGVTEALVSTHSAIPKLQSALNSALHKDKWNDTVREHLVELLRTPEGEKTSEDKVLSGVVRGVMAGLETGAVDKQDSGKDCNTNIEMPKAAVDAAIAVVREQLDAVCTVVDYVDWEGVEG